MREGESLRESACFSIRWLRSYFDVAQHERGLHPAETLSLSSIRHSTFDI